MFAQSLNPEAANACIISLICAWLYLCPTNSIVMQWNFTSRHSFICLHLQNYSQSFYLQSSSSPFLPTKSMLKFALFSRKKILTEQNFFTVVNVSFLFYSKTVKVSSFVFPPFINTTHYSFIFLVKHSSTFSWCCDTVIHISSPVKSFVTKWHSFPFA